MREAYIKATEKWERELSRSVNNSMNNVLNLLEPIALHRRSQGVQWVHVHPRSCREFLHFGALTTLRLHKDISQFDIIIPSCPDWQLLGYLHKGSQDQQSVYKNSAIAEMADRTGHISYPSRWGIQTAYNTWLRLSKVTSVPKIGSIGLAAWVGCTFVTDDRQATELLWHRPFVP